MGGLWGAAGLRGKQQHSGWWLWVASTYHSVRGLNILIHKDLHSASEKLTSWEVKCKTVSCSLHIREAKDKEAHQVIRHHTWMFPMDHYDVSIREPVRMWLFQESVCILAVQQQKKLRLLPSSIPVTIIIPDLSSFIAIALFLILMSCSGCPLSP